MYRGDVKSFTRLHSKKKIKKFMGLVDDNKQINLYVTVHADHSDPKELTEPSLIKTAVHVLFTYDFMNYYFLDTRWTRVQDAMTEAIKYILSSSLRIVTADDLRPVLGANYRRGISVEDPEFNDHITVMKAEGYENPTITTYYAHQLRKRHQMFDLSRESKTPHI